MHFTVYAILKNKKLEDFDYDEFEEEFYNKFCDGCGENEPEVEPVCDWFQLGGRWVDNLVARRGIHGESSWFDLDHKPQENHYSVCETKDLIEIGESFEPYAFAIDDEYVEEGCARYNKILEQVRRGKLNGVLVLLDCHM